MDINKKIAVLCNYQLLPERVGGMDYFFWEFNQKCNENNIDVDWFFPNKNKHGEYSKLNIIASNYQNVEVCFLNYCKITNRNYSYIITHFVELCTTFFYKIKQISDAKIIVVDHNPRPIGGYSIKKKLEKKIKGFLFSKYIDVYVGVSSYTVKEIINDFGKRIKNRTVLIFNGLELSKYCQKNNFNSNNNFIVACHLRKEKGIQDLIEAVNLLNQEEKHNFTIAIYGAGNYESELKQMISDFSISDYFSFKGSVANLNEIYHKYDYLIHPSHGETFCYTVVESLLSKLPVITTEKAGNVLGLVNRNQNGFLFEAKNINQLKVIFSKILNKEISIQNFSTENEMLKKLTLEEMVNNHFKLLI